MENEEEDDSLLLELEGDNGAERPPFLASAGGEEDAEDLLSALEAEDLPVTFPNRSRLQKRLLCKALHNRRFQMRASALYEHPPMKTISRRYQKTAAGRDISLYQVNEAAPRDDYFKNFLISLLILASSNPDKVKRLRRYLGPLAALGQMWIIYTRLVCW